MRLLSLASFCSLVFVIAISARPAGGEPLLEPGLSLVYRMEMISEGQRSDETLRVDVGDRSSSGLWNIELILGGAELRYRALYEADGPGPVFSDHRFVKLEVWDSGWRESALNDVEVLTTLRDIEARVAAMPAAADSTIDVSNRSLACHSLSFSDSSTSVQRGETVTLSIETRSYGHLWISDDVPFGGWVRYEERRDARKTTEFSGRSFAGEVEQTQETWQLESISQN